MIGIVDYGLGNLTSVAGVVEKLGFEPRITCEPDELARAEKLILPGVGAFGDGMAKLRERDLIAPLGDMVLEDGKPILGICLGFQLIATDSKEFGDHQGLGWIDASVRRLDPGSDDLRVPHVGWNNLIQKHDSILFDDIPEDALFYYVHSFHLVPADDAVVIGECEYGARFVAVAERDNIRAVQFHPEKSQLHGLKLLENFLTKA